MSKVGDRLQSLFAAALALEGRERDAFLAREGADDPALLAQLRGLLDADAKLAGTTARPVALGLTQVLASTAPGASLSGLHIGPFELREELGRGGMGVVYRAERVDGTVEQQVAIKFVRRELHDPNTLKRFQLERQMLASLDHPNIARLIDASELEDGTPYYVMEYVGGAPVDEYCAQAKLGVRECVELMRTVCDTVAHAHRNLIVHRDLKPSNIHVSAAGIPKLLDFGIAKPLAATHEATGTADRFFSPRYAAPEQLLGAPIGVGCDVYALGLLLFELLAGRPAFDFEGLTQGHIERLVCEVPPPAPSTVAPDRGRARTLRGDLDGIVLRCLRKSPTERYSSVEQLEADLGNYLEGRPVQACGGHAWYRARKFVARNRAGVATALVVVALVIGFILRLQVERDAARAERDRADKEAQFLVDVFKSADPGESLDRTMPVSKVLENGRQRLKLELRDEPILRARLFGVLADVYSSLGDYDAMTELLDSVESTADSGAHVDREWVEHWLRRSALALARGDAATGRAMAQRAIDLQTRLGDRPGQRWKARLQLWKAENGWAPREASLASAKALLADVEKEPQISSRARAEVELAVAEKLLFESQIAEPLIRDAISRLRAELPANHPDLLYARTTLASVLHWQLKRTDEAIEELRDIWHQQETLFTERSTGAALARLRFAQMLYLKEGRDEEARTNAEAACEVLRAIRTWPSDVFLACTGVLADIYGALGRYDDAAAQNAEMLKLTEALYGKDNFSYRLGQLNYARALVSLGKLDEAEPYYRELVPATGEVPADRIAAGFDLAKLEHRRGRDREAAELLARIEPFYRASKLEYYTKRLPELDHFAAELACGRSDHAAECVAALPKVPPVVRGASVRL